MSEIGETFAALREIQKERKASNLSKSIALLDERGIQYRRLSSTHIRIGRFDFWPSTGLFLERPTGHRGRGVFKLLKQLEQS